ncbi:tRNA isopentenyltransferase [Hypoxylon sp. NC1633]|nr:tRNA isopentenyltransferase [Hypoxylon sp. NC1633]
MPPINLIHFMIVPKSHFLRFLHRNVRRMATASPPKEPLVVIMGTTGTGKSDLAVELALRFNGEVINADAMQMYRGLPVVTNQLSLRDQRGIPHHLLSTIDPHEPTWSVEVFEHEATRLIREIRNRGKLPIVVGGTHYYIHALLFNNALIVSQDNDNDSMQHRSREENESQFPILSGPTETMLERLRVVDPTMANRWHPRDRRKIRRSLEIFLTTGRRASDIYAEQQRSTSFNPAVNSWQSLMFWVYTDPKILKKRLDQRVEKMYSNGMMEELRCLHESLLLRTETGEDVDLSRGIWQSIGYKQMKPFLETERKTQKSSTPSPDVLRETGLEEIRIATRQYARYQLRWIKNKSTHALKDQGSMDHLFLLDSSDADGFSANVLEPAAKLCQSFISGQALVKPTELSTTASEVLTPLKNWTAKPLKLPFEVKTCEICGTSISEVQWEAHLRGYKHRRALGSTGKKGIGTKPIPLDPEKQHLEKGASVSPVRDVFST